MSVRLNLPTKSFIKTYPTIFLFYPEIKRFRDDIVGSESVMAMQKEVGNYAPICHLVKKNVSISLRMVKTMMGKYLPIIVVEIVWPGKIQRLERNSKMRTLKVVTIAETGIKTHHGYFVTLTRILKPSNIFKSYLLIRNF